MSYESLNAEHIRDLLEEHISKLENKTYNRTLEIKSVWRELSIFDTWKDRLSITDLKNMKHFLNTAMELGLRGYVCFKVGASGCANGMWCSDRPSTNGHSPEEGYCIWHSFTPDYNKWSLLDGDEILYNGNLRGLRKFVKKLIDEHKFVPQYQQVEIAEPKTEMTTYNIGYSTPHDTFTETQFDVDNMTDLFNLFLDYAKENGFLDNELRINYIEEVNENESY